FFGIDSEYDYDPVWAKCVELGVAPSFHSAGMGWGSRVSISNYMYNHIGHFASAAEALAKSLFLGGVTRRFPSLRFAFLEGGVAWACRLYAELVSHWQKRHGEGLANYDPAQLDRELFQQLHARYGGPAIRAKLDQVLRVGAGVEREVISQADFLDFTFTNAIRLFAGANPDFVKGTAVEAEVAQALRVEVGRVEV